VQIALVILPSLDCMGSWHKQINKFMNQDYSGVEHWHDVWHVAKGKYHTIIVCNIIGLMKNKLQKAAKYKDCPVIGEWTKSITNHMYWCASSSPDGDDEMMKRDGNL